MKLVYNCIAVVFILPLVLRAQLSVVSTSPTNNQTNVSTTTTITVTFSAQLDTNAMRQKKDFAFTNIHDNNAKPYFTATQLIVPNVQLQPNTAYFIMIFYAKAVGGSVMATPYIFYFTTGSSFPTTTVSGTVSSGSTGASPANALVGLNTFDIQNGGGNENDGPDFAMMALVNADGSFTIPYVSDGTYWPIAAKDVNGDGDINPDGGTDVIAVGDSVVVSGTNVTGLALTFVTFTPYLFSEAIPKANNLAATLPSGSLLKFVQTYEMDTLGRARQWEFLYDSPSTSQLFDVKVSPSESRVEQMNSDWYQWLKDLTPLNDPSTAASSATVMANVEAAGGKSFRTKQGMSQYQFQIQVSLGDQGSQFSGQFWYLPRDPSKQYWGVAYKWYVDNDTMWTTVEEMGFFCDFTTGAVVASGIPTGVEVRDRTVPSAFSLEQNYPNPFNPFTRIRYAVPVSGFVALKVYNVLGKEVASLVNETKSVGFHSVIFHADNLPSGIYFYTLRAGSSVETKKMMLVK